MNIVLDRVLLRRPEPRDAEYLYQYRNDWEVTRSLGGFSKGYSVQDIHSWIDFHRSQADEILWTIADREDDRCLGHAGLYRIDHRVRSAEFAILIGDTRFWGQGLATEVTRAVVDFGFQQLNLHRIELSLLATNIAALRVYEKVGFQHEGVLRHAQYRDRSYVDVVMMAILEDEW